MRNVILKLSIQIVAFRIEQISDYQVTIGIPRHDHGVIGVEGNSSAAQKRFFVHLLQLLGKHVDDDQVAPEESLQAALAGYKCNSGGIRTTESGVEDLRSAWLHGVMLQKSVLLRNDGAVTGFGQDQVLVLSAHGRANNLV
jgi:hypothetical protein